MVQSVITYAHIGKNPTGCHIQKVSESMNHTHSIRSAGRVVSLLLCLALMLALLCGCSGEEDPSTGTAGTDTAAATEEKTTDTQQPAESGSAPTGETEPVDLGEIVNREKYTDDEITVDDPRLEQVVAVCGETGLTNRMFQIYYCMQYHNFLNQYGMYAYYFGLDTSKPLCDQPSVQTGMSWEQLFAESALEQFRQFGAVTEKARAEGFTLTDDMAKELQDAIDGIDEDASSKGYESVDAYIQESFGPTITKEAFVDFLKSYYYVMNYEDQMYNSISFTDEDLMEYFMNHREDNTEYQNVAMDKGNINVRHILIQPEDADNDQKVSDEEKAAAKAKAEEILTAWKEDPTEDNFAALAKEHTTDPGSKETGGLYEEVYPGQMVASFNDWCFDPARKTGDTDIVETDYGFHIMYFVKQTGNYQWKILAKRDYTSERMSVMLKELIDAHPTEVDYAALVLAPLPLMTTSAE